MSSTLTKDQKNKAARVCQIVASGVSLREACRVVKIAPSTFRTWRIASGDLETQYARAKEDRATNIFEDILNIVDDSDADPQDRRIRMDARKWMLGKMSPKRYGDKLDVTSGDKPMEPFTGFTLVDLRADDAE